MSAPAANRTRRIPLGDTNIRGGLMDRPDNFKVKKGTASIVRVLTHPLGYYGARVNYANDPNKGFFAISLASAADNEAALAGDAAAIERCKAVCPLWARGYDVGQRFVCMLWEAAQESSRGIRQPCEKLWPWAFSAKIYQQLTMISNTLPINPNTKAPLAFNRIELRAEVGPGQKDEMYQNIVIVPLVQASQQTSKFSDVWAKVGKFFRDIVSPTVPVADPYSETATSDILEDFIAPDGFNQMNESLDRAQGIGKFATAPDSNADLGGDLTTGHAPQQGQPAQQAPPRAAPRTGRAGAAPNASAPIRGTTNAAPSAPTNARGNAPVQQQQAQAQDPGENLDNLLPDGGELDLD